MKLYKVKSRNIVITKILGWKDTNQLPWHVEILMKISMSKVFALIQNVFTISDKISKIMIWKKTFMVHWPWISTIIYIQVQWNWQMIIMTILSCLILNEPNTLFNTSVSVKIPFNFLLKIVSTLLYRSLRCLWHFWNICFWTGVKLL